MNKNKRCKPIIVEKFEPEPNPIRFCGSILANNAPASPSTARYAVNMAAHAIRGWGLGTLQEFLLDGVCDEYFDAYETFKGAYFRVFYKCAPNMKLEPDETPQETLARLAQLRRQKKRLPTVKVSVFIHEFGTFPEVEETIRTVLDKDFSDSPTPWGAFLLRVNNVQDLHVIHPDDAERIMLLVRGAYDSYIDAQGGGSS